MQKGETGRAGCIFQHFFSRYGVKTVYDRVHTFQQRGQIIGCNGKNARVNLQIGCDIQQTLPADQGLRSAQRLFRTEILAIQVAFLKDVRIAQAKASCAHTGQQACYMSAKPSASGYEYAEGKQTRHLARGKHSPVATKALRPDILLQQDNHGVFKRDAEKLGQSGDTLAADVKAVVIPIFRIWFQQAVQFMLVKGT